MSKRAKVYLTPKQAGGCLSHSGYEPRPGWCQATYWRGPLQFDAVQILHSQSGRLGVIRSLVRCATSATANGYIFPFERHFPGNARLPVLIDVVGAKAAKTKRVLTAHAEILAAPEHFGCSGIEIMAPDFLYAGARLANARLILSARIFATPAEQAKVITRLRSAGGRATIAEITAGSAAGAIDRSSLLRSLLAGCIRLENETAPLAGSATVTF